jgi:hypothetical protein
MSITMMVGKEKAGLPGVKEISYPGCKEPLYMETTHVGLVLRTGEVNGYDDSDFYAVVWNPVRKCPERIEYATTRAWTYPNHAEADATPEVRAAYEEWCRIEKEKAAAAKAELDAKTPAKGKLVKVVAGRKVAIGTVGRIFWVGKPEKYSPSRWAKTSTKIGIALDDAKDDRGRYVNVAWTYIDNVEAVPEVA